MSVLVTHALYVPIRNERHTMTRSHWTASTPDPETPTPTRTALPPNPKKAWAAILEALVLPPTADPETVDAAYGALALEMRAMATPSASTLAALGRRYNLSAREIAMFAEPRLRTENRNVEERIARYVETKRQMAR